MSQIWNLFFVIHSVCIATVQSLNPALFCFRFDLTRYLIGGYLCATLVVLESLNLKWHYKRFQRISHHQLIYTHAMSVFVCRGSFNCYLFAWLRIARINSDDKLNSSQKKHKWDSSDERSVVFFCSEWAETSTISRDSYFINFDVQPCLAWISFLVRLSCCRAPNPLPCGEWICIWSRAQFFTLYSSEHENICICLQIVAVFSPQYTLLVFGK